MHKFLKSIGFSDFKKKDLEIILNEIIASPQMVKVTKDSEGNEFAELSKEFAANVGITVRGNYLENDKFEMEYFYPYFYGTSLTTQEEITVEKHSEKESYAGVCEDSNIGVTLIFYLQNIADYLSEKNRRTSGEKMYGAYLSGLSVEGSILLPIEKFKEKANKCRYSERSQLVAQAREGDEEAIESLTLEDMDMYSILSRRVMKEDIFSIVSSTFMPYGIESDQYSILGEILDYTIVENAITKEIIYCMKIECNDLIFDICINGKDLMGEPAVGRRFKGNIWMQGSVQL